MHPAMASGGEIRARPTCSGCGARTKGHTGRPGPDCVGSSAGRSMVDALQSSELPTAHDVVNDGELLGGRSIQSASQEAMNGHTPNSGSHSDRPSPCQLRGRGRATRTPAQDWGPDDAWSSDEATVPGQFSPAETRRTTLGRGRGGPIYNTSKPGGLGDMVRCQTGHRRRVQRQQRRQQPPESTSGRHHVLNAEPTPSGRTDSPPTRHTRQEFESARTLTRDARPKDIHRSSCQLPPRDHLMDFYDSDCEDDCGEPKWPHVQDISYRPIPGTEHVSKQAVRKALNGEFTDLSDFICSNAAEFDELKSSVDAEGNVCFKSQRARKAISGAYRWLEAWGVFEIILTKAYGFEVFLEMSNYRNFILSLFQKFKIAYVFDYDIKHRRRLACLNSFKFSKLSHDLYVVTFDSHALKSSNTKCSKCSSHDHNFNECPFRGQGGHQNGPPAKGGKRAESRKSQICYGFQDGSCQFGAKCQRRHVCRVCQGPDGLDSCSKCKRLLQTATASAKD